MTQAAKIIGSGLATIGLKNVLLSVIHNDNLLLSKVIYTELVKKAINTVESMLNSLSKDSIILNYLEREIMLSKLVIIGKNKDNILIVDNMIPLISSSNYEDIKNINSDFYIAGVYLFNSPNNEQYIGSCMNFYSRLIEHKDQFKNRRKPTKLHLHEYKLEEYK